MFFSTENRRGKGRGSQATLYPPGVNPRTPNYLMVNIHKGGLQLGLLKDSAKERSHHSTRTAPLTMKDQLLYTPME